MHEIDEDMYADVEIEAATITGLTAFGAYVSASHSIQVAVNEATVLADQMTADKRACKL